MAGWASLAAAPKATTGWPRSGRRPPTAMSTTSVRVRPRQDVAADADTEAVGQLAGRHRRSSRQRRLLDEPAVAHRHDVAERRPAGAGERPQVHQHELVVGVGRWPLVDDRRRTPSARRWRARLGRGAAGSPAASTTIRASSVAVPVSNRLPHGRWCDRLSESDMDVDVRPPGARGGRRCRRCRTAARGRGGGDRGRRPPGDVDEAGIGHVVDVVTPRAVRRRPRRRRPDHHVARPAGRHAAPAPAPPDRRRRR